VESFLPAFWPFENDLLVVSSVAFLGTRVCDAGSEATQATAMFGRKIFFSASHGKYVHFRLVLELGFQLSTLLGDE
jgi:hypothetical protein